MNRARWKEILYDSAKCGHTLGRLVRKHFYLFDAEDRRVLRLIHCDEWDQIQYGVRQELRSERGLPCDFQAPGFVPTRRVYHPIRRILMPGTLMAATKAARNPNKVVTV